MLDSDGTQTDVTSGDTELCACHTYPGGGESRGGDCTRKRGEGGASTAMRYEKSSATRCQLTGLSTNA